MSLFRGVTTLQDLFDCLEYDSRVEFKLNNNSFEMSDVLKYKNYTEGGQEDPWINFPRLTTHAPTGATGHNIAQYIYYIKLQRPISNELSSTDEDNKKVEVSDIFGKNTIESKFLNDTITPLTTVGELKSRLVKDPDATWVVNDKNGTKKQDEDYLRPGDTITVNGTKGDRVYEIKVSYDEMLYSDYDINYQEGFIESSENNKITKKLTLGELKNNCFYAENAIITFLRNGNGIDESQSIQNGDVIKITIQEGWSTKTKEFTIKSLPVYFIEFNGNGASGKVPNSLEVIDGETSSSLPDPINLVITDKVFWGWNTQIDGKGDSFQTGDVIENVNKNITLYAIWKDAQEQPAPTENMVGIAPTSASGADGKITGTTKDMEYRLSTEETYHDIKGSQITDLKAGIYYIRYKEKYGYKAGTEKVIQVPQYTVKNSTLGEYQGTFDKKTGP